jgi:hypothetical protein
LINEALKKKKHDKSDRRGLQQVKAVQKPGLWHMQEQGLLAADQ